MSMTRSRDFYLGGGLGLELWATWRDDGSLDIGGWDKGPESQRSVRFWGADPASVLAELRAMASAYANAEQWMRDCVDGKL